MGLLSSAIATQPSVVDKPGGAARQVEAMVLKVMLEASGAFAASDSPGASIHAQLFTEALADAVAGQSSLGLAQLLERQPPPHVAEPPTETGLIAGPSHRSSGFGLREDPLGGGRSFHAGLDLAAPEGSPVCAAASGRVVKAGPRGDYGNAVEVAHPDGTTTLYGHVGTFSVSEGESVSAGQTIATVGSTGRSTGNHLHFEVRANGRPVDPLQALQKYRLRAEEGGNPLSPKRAP